MEDVNKNFDGYFWKVFPFLKKVTEKKTVEWAAPLYQGSFLTLQESNGRVYYGRVVLYKNKNVKIKIKEKEDRIIISYALDDEAMDDGESSD